MQQRILEYLNEHPARRLLWLGATSGALALPETEILQLRLAELAEDKNRLSGHIFDCAVLQDLPGPLSKREAESLVAQLRDVTAQRILWLVGLESPWERHDLLALGFRHLDHNNQGEQLYGFDIDNYKQTPDWLNAKHWANPEQWDKNRW